MIDDDDMKENNFQYYKESTHTHLLFFWSVEKAPLQAAVSMKCWWVERSWMLHKYMDDDYYYCRSDTPKYTYCR